jgi:hypothetical protein
MQYYSTQGIDGQPIGMYKNTNPRLMDSHAGPNSYKNVPVRLKGLSHNNQYYVQDFKLLK